MKAIKELMRNFPSSCVKNDSLQVVANQMTISNLEFLPVVDEKMEVIGTITYTDAMVLIGKNEKTELRVSDVMKTETYSITTYDDEASALKVMRNTHASYLPVVDEKNHLKGVVSFVTLARRIILLKQELRKDAEKMKVQGLGISA